MEKVLLLLLVMVSAYLWFDRRGLKQQLKAMEREVKEAKELAFCDPLTGIANRRCFEEELVRYWNRIRHDKGYMAILLADIDKFGCYNNEYGHQQGDTCLRRVANCMRMSLRPGDVIARYGGEEFVVILPCKDREEAVAVAGRLREKVEDINIPHVTSPVSEWVTISVGVAAGIPGQTYRSPKEIIKAADDALYAAKAHGRNRVEAAD